METVTLELLTFGEILDMFQANAVRVNHLLADRAIDDKVWREALRARLVEQSHLHDTLREWNAQNVRDNAARAGK